MWLNPTWATSCLSQTPPSFLKAQGIRGALMDLDNTLMIPRTPIIPKTIEAWLAEAKQIGFPIVIVSNNKNPAYLAQAETLLTLPVIGFAQKPRRQFLREGLAKLGLPAQDVVVIGDRPLTDILGGQRLGCKTVWVKNLTHQDDKPLIQLLRRLESISIVGAKRFFQHHSNTPQPDFPS
jgi:uncharacterized protein